MIGTGPRALGQRRQWSELPPRLVAEVERLLGSHVVLAESVSLGFSPAVAARLRLSDGRSVFAKARPLDMKGHAALSEWCIATW